MKTSIAFLLLILGYNAPVFAQNTALSNLTKPRMGKVAHYSSRDKSGGNADFITIPPGKTVNLMDCNGSGVVRRIWLTIAPFNIAEVQRQGIIRCYWDGEKLPSVEVPASDFFGMGFGEFHDFISRPLSMTSGGYNCYWAMPFQKSARITYENRSSKPVDALYWNISVEKTVKPDAEALYFHASFRRTTTVRGVPVTILQAKGRGNYVGTLISMQPLKRKGFGYLEGDERISVDGESVPSMVGTGTEDYFSGGWYFNSGNYSAPYHGVRIIAEPFFRVNAYRWHIEDPIPFQKSLNFTIEHGGINDAPDVDYTSLAYWYQTHPHAPLPPLPANLLPYDALKPFHIVGIQEAEAQVSRAIVSGGTVERQDTGVFDGDWSGDAQLWWKNTGRSGETLTLSLNADADAEYDLIGYFTNAPDYGRFSVKVNGVLVGSIVNGYASRVRASGAVNFGRVRLMMGVNPITLTLVGKDDPSTGTLVGVDGFVLRR